MNFVISGKMVCREPFVYVMGATGEDCVGRTDGRKMPMGGMPVEIPSI